MRADSKKIDKLVRDMCAELPAAGNLTVAKELCKKYPDVFSDIESARNNVRYRRGSYGVSNRRYLSNPVLAVLSKGKRRIPDSKPFRVKSGVAAVLCDLHMPYHSDESIEIALDVATKEKVNTIILGGDYLDCHSISKWQTDPRERNFQEELNSARQFLKLLRKRFPKVEIVYKLGNHEERYESYLYSKAPEWTGVDSMQLDAVLFLDDFNITLVDDKRRIKIGDLNFIHGHEYRFQISNPVNPARGLFLKAKEFAMCGHFHQSSYHSEKTMDDRIMATWSLGCLCDLKPWYMPMNNWVHGFALVESEDGGKFNVQNKIIRHGKIY